MKMEKTMQSSMELIESAEKTMIISSELGHGLKRDEPQEQPMKKCSKCGRMLPKTSFNKNRKTKDGLQSECRECHAETMRRYHLKKAEEIKANESSIKEKETASKVQESKMIKVYSNVELAKFSPRQLMEELKARGFKWEYMLEPQRKIYFEKI
jgi:predicted HTH domain antitoxin